MKSITVWMLALLACVSFAQAQKAPPRGADGGTVSTPADDAMPAQKAGPRTGSSAAEAQMQPPPDELVNQFKQAYKKAGRPKILFIVGINRDLAVPQGKGGSVMGKGSGPGVGENIDFNDDTGITEVLENGIGEILNDDGRLRMIDPSVLAENDKREALVKSNNDADGAVDAMAQKVNADLVLFIKFRPVNRAEGGGHGISFRCISELKNINEGTKMPLTPFDWDGPLTNERARVYNSALATLICERYSKAVKAGGGMKQMSVQILGLSDSSMTTALKRGIRKIDGVDPTVDLTTENTTDGGINGTYEFEYDGDVSDLQDGITKVGSDNNLTLAVLDQKKNSIIFRAGGGVAAGPEWWLITDAKDNPVKQRFADHYKKNPQSVALAMNWLVEPQQVGWIEQLKQPPILKITSDTSSDKMLAPQTAKLEQARTDIASAFQQIGVQMVDGSQFGRIAQREGDKAAKLQKDNTLQTILENDDGYDLLCMGSVSSGGALDFKVVNRKNAKWIGGVIWPPSSFQLAQDSVSRHKLEHAMQNPDNIKGDAAITRYIAGNLLLAIEQAISNSATLAVTVRNAPDQGSVQSVADAMKNIEEVSTDGVRMDNGLGSFNLHYSGAFQDLEERLRRMVESKPNLKLVEINPSVMAVEVVKK